MVVLDLLDTLDDPTRTGLHREATPTT